MIHIIKHILAYLLIGSSVIMYLTFLMAHNMASRSPGLADYAVALSVCGILILIGLLLL